MKQNKHFSMIRSFHLADWLTLGNAMCGVGALFAVMSYLQSRDVLQVLVACALVLLAFVFDLFWMAASRVGGRKLRRSDGNWIPWPM